MLYISTKISWYISIKKLQCLLKIMNFKMPFKNFFSFFFACTIIFNALSFNVFLSCKISNWTKLAVVRIQFVLWLLNEDLISLFSDTDYIHIYIYIIFWFSILFLSVAKILVTCISDPLVVKSDTPSVKQALASPNL